MTDTSQVRSDLAFMKAVADDSGPLPRTIGEHMLVPGLVFGANFLLIWAIQDHRLAWPAAWNAFLWAPGALLYLAAWPFLMARQKGAVIGPGARAFVAAWVGVALMTLASILMLFSAWLLGGQLLFQAWPAMAFVLYGGAWATVAIVRGSWGWGGVALGSFATAVVAGAVLLQPAAYLVMAAGLILFVALPGLGIIRRAGR